MALANTTDNDKNNKPLNWELYDKDATTKLTDQMALYDTEVYYDDSTKRYVVQIFAKEENDTEKANDRQLNWQKSRKRMPQSATAVCIISASRPLPMQSRTM